MGDPERYRSSEEIKKWQDGDPITALRKIIVSKRMGMLNLLQRPNAFGKRKMEKMESSVPHEKYPNAKSGMECQI